MTNKDFWYILCERKDLKPNKVLSLKILGEWLAVFLDERGQPAALMDRCLHRSAQLSKGQVYEGRLTCPYHGWTYNGDGKVTKIPSESPHETKGTRCTKKYPLLVQDDYVYVRLNHQPTEESLPFKVPSYKKPGYASIRLVNRFQNNVINCAENFVDIPHTTYVHPTIFRNAKQQKLKAVVERKPGHVFVDYINETNNFGIFSWFLNPKKEQVRHTDEFFMPNITTVNYYFGGGKHFIITSQSVPVTETETLVYTDLTYNYGIWNTIARPIIRWQAQKIIDQDIEILNNQMATIQKYGAQFSNSPADIIHTYIESINHELVAGRDPRLLPEKKSEIEFWV